MTNSNASPVKKGIRLRKRVGRFLGLYFFFKSAPSGYCLCDCGDPRIDQLYSYYTLNPNSRTQQDHLSRPYIQTTPFRPKTVPLESIFHIMAEAADNNPAVLYEQSIFTVESTQLAWSISHEPRPRGSLRSLRVGLCLPLKPHPFCSPQQVLIAPEADWGPPDIRRVTAHCCDPRGNATQNKPATAAAACFSGG